MSEIEKNFIVLSAEWRLAQVRWFISGQAFSHIVVVREEPRQYHVFPESSLFTVLDQFSADTTVTDALDLQETDAASVNEGGLYDGPTDKRIVIVTEGVVRGFLEPKPTVFHLMMRTKPRFLFSPDIFPDDPAPPKSFEAFPALNLPASVPPAEKFDIAVGFQATPEPGSDESEKIVVARPDPKKDCLVVLTADGIQLDRDYDNLKLQLGAMAHFTGALKPGVETASVKAQFFYDGQLIGQTRRLVSRAGSAIASAASSSPAVPVSPTDAAGAVDITVSVTWCRDGTLSWRLASPNASDEITRQTLGTSLPETTSFAANLMRDLKTQDHRGPGARNILENTGQDIAALMPPDFFVLLRQVHAALGRAPSLLLITNEALVPWELAYLDEPLDPNVPPFLAAQTRMGRWLEDTGVMLPPAVGLTVQRISAVAAAYGLEGDAGLPQLKEALQEQQDLVKAWKARPVTASKLEVDALITGESLPGHLVHFAVHGYVNPDTNEQTLRLNDGTQLPASALTGALKRGKPPRFSFVFLNACQVGTPGRTLGYAGGFPGILVRRGTLGFIAPLWEVDDGLARERAESFYRETFAGGAVGAVLQAGRAGYVDQSTTPMAYIYYGHPSLRLTLAQT